MPTLPSSHDCRWATHTTRITQMLFAHRRRADEFDDLTILKEILRLRPPNPADEPKPIPPNVVKDVPALKYLTTYASMLEGKYHLPHDASIRLRMDGTLTGQP